MKRTYNLSEQAVATVRRAVESGSAPTQDAFVESAITLLARRKEEEREALLWQNARHDPEFAAEMEVLDREFAWHDAQVPE